MLRQRVDHPAPPMLRSRWHMGMEPPRCVRSGTGGTMQKNSGAVVGQVEEQFLTCALVARRANVTPETVRDWNRRGRLPASRTASGIRLFRRADVDALI